MVNNSYEKELAMMKDVFVIDVVAPSRDDSNFLGKLTGDLRGPRPCLLIHP